MAVSRFRRRVVHASPCHRGHARPRRQLPMAIRRLAGPPGLFDNDRFTVDRRRPGTTKPGLGVRSPRLVARLVRGMGRVTQHAQRGHRLAIGARARGAPLRRQESVRWQRQVRAFPRRSAAATRSSTFDWNACFAKSPPLPPAVKMEARHTMTGSVAQRCSARLCCL